MTLLESVLCGRPPSSLSPLQHWDGPLSEKMGVHARCVYARRRYRWAHGYPLKKK